MIPMAFAKNAYNGLWEKWLSGLDENGCNGLREWLQWLRGEIIQK
jgi:hypothetical protein